MELDLNKKLKDVPTGKSHLAENRIGMFIIHVKENKSFVRNTY